MNIKNENIETLIVTYLSGNADKEEKFTVENWLEESEINKKRFAEVADVWEASGAYKPILTNTTDRFEKLEERIKNKKRIKFVPFNLLRYAAIFIFALALGVFVSYFINSGGEQQVKSFGESKIIAPNGSRTNMILPDGSQVWLNAGSSITYCDGFASGNKREITLVGEAYFKVKKNKEKPFIVQTEDAVIRALGTSFNVKAYPEEPTIEATLVEGSIAVSKKQENSQEIILKPNQQVTINKDKFLVKNIRNDKDIDEQDVVKDEKEEEIIIQANVNIPKYTSWKDNRWIIDNEELGSLAKKLERRYAVKIEFKSDKHRKIRFSGTLMEESLEQVLEVISFASTVTFEVNGTSVVFDSK